MTVLTDDLLASFDDSVGPVDEARLLPPVLYTSPEFYDFERQAIFQREWLCVGRVDQLKEPGDFRCITIAGEPLIAARDSGGELRVLSAVCRHRGMVIAEGSGNCRRFTCPYHHWSYGLDGGLLGTPAMERAVDFDHRDHNLPELKVEIWQGFIMANFDLNARPFGPTMTKIDDMLTNYGLESTTTLEGKTIGDLPWNWKVMMENFNDPYHASRLHGPLQTFAPSHMNDFLVWDDTDGAIGRIQHFTDIDSSFNPTQRCILPVFSNLTTEQRKRGGFVMIPPTLALAIVPDEVAYFIISPQDARPHHHPDRLLPGAVGTSGPPVRLPVQGGRGGRQQLQRAGHLRGRHDPAGPQLASRAPRPLLVAGGDPGPVQPLAGEALPRALALQRRLIRRPT